MATKTPSNSSFIAGRRSARGGDYYVGPIDYETGPHTMHAPLSGDVSAHADRVKVRKNQRLSPLNSEVTHEVPDETPQN